MSFSDNIPKLKPFSRSVSIIGVGATPFIRILDDPTVHGMNDTELLPLGIFKQNGRLNFTFTARPDRDGPVISRHRICMWQTGLV